MHPRPPLVALTAGAMTGDLQRCLDAGMDAMLIQPLKSTGSKNRSNVRIASPSERGVSAGQNGVITCLVRSDGILLFGGIV